MERASPADDRLRSSTPSIPKYARLASNRDAPAGTGTKSKVR